MLGVDSLPRKTPARAPPAPAPPQQFAPQPRAQALPGQFGMGRAPMGFGAGYGAGIRSHSPQMPFHR